MTDMTFEQELLQEAQKLDPEQQRMVLNLVRTLTSRPAGEPGWSIIQHAREINFPKEDLAEIAQAIETYCEVVGELPDVDLDA